MPRFVNRAVLDPRGPVPPVARPLVRPATRPACRRDGVRSNARHSHPGAARSSSAAAWDTSAPTSAPPALTTRAAEGHPPRYCGGTRRRQAGLHTPPYVLASNAPLSGPRASFMLALDWPRASRISSVVEGSRHDGQAWRSARSSCPADAAAHHRSVDRIEDGPHRHALFR
jgi:hypothetical protein